MYKNYSALYSRQAEAEVNKFLRSDHSLKEYREKIDHFKSLAGEITSMDNFVPFHLFLIDCTPIKEVRYGTLDLWAELMLFFYFARFSLFDNVASTLHNMPSSNIVFVISL